jgi:checkpoint serine/threonine-protein kinase
MESLSEKKENVDTSDAAASQTSKNDKDTEEKVLTLDMLIKHFEKKIKKSNSSDSLELYLNGIKACERFVSEESDPKDKKKLSQFYSDSIIRCSKNEAYKSDEKFLKFFAHYALNYDTNPQAVFKSIYSKGFGKKSADFMISWAKLFELSDNDQAVSILQIGLANDAEPVEKIREFYKQIKPFVREKFAFSAKPLGNICFINSDEPGMQFEEIRAQTYRFAYELFSKFKKTQVTTLDHDASAMEKLLAEKEDLKRRLTEAEEKLQVQVIRNSQLLKRDSIVNQTTKDTSIWYNKTQTTDQTTDFTNVTFADMTVAADESSAKSDNNNSHQNLSDMDCEDSDAETDTTSKPLPATVEHSGLKLKNFNFILAKLAKEDLTLRTMPTSLQPPQGVSMLLSNSTLTTDYSGNLLKNNDKPVGKSAHDTYTDENSLLQPPQGVSMLLSNSTLTTDYSENLLKNYDKPVGKSAHDTYTDENSLLFKQLKHKDDIQFKIPNNNDTTFMNDSPLTERIFCAASKFSNLVKQPDLTVTNINQSIQRKNVNTTLTNDQDKSNDEFSIFIDNDNSNRSKINAGLNKLPAQPIEDAPTQYFYDQTTVKDLHSNALVKKSQNVKADEKRKPLAVILDAKRDEETNSDLTTLDFDPGSASTRFLPSKPFNDICNTTEHRFEKEFQNDKEQEEKAKLLAHFLNVSDKGESNKAEANQNHEDSMCSQTKRVRFDTVTHMTNTKKTSSGLDWENEVSAEGEENETEDLFAQPSSLATDIDTKKGDVTMILEESPFRFIDKTEKINRQHEASYTEESILTSEDMERSFNNNYYQLCAVDISMNTTNTIENLSANKFSLNASKVKINASRLLDISELSGCNFSKIQMDTSKVFDKSRCETLRNKTIAELTNKMPILNESSLENKTFIEDNNEDDSNEVSTLNETTSTNLNDTILQAIRNPFDSEIKHRLLIRTGLEYLKSKNDYFNIKAMAPMIKEKYQITLGGNFGFKVSNKIGKGSYAVIYKIVSKEKWLALKVDRQATAWEFYVTEKFHERLDNLRELGQMGIDVRKSFIKIKHFTKFTDGCFSVMDYYKLGSLLNLINYHTNQNPIPYWFVLYMTLEMLNILDFLHKCKILHADIKPDNFLIDQLPSDLDFFEANRTKCLVLIDFNRSIDQTLLPDQTEFFAKVDNKSLLCCEMKSDRSWSSQIDFYGVLFSVHCMMYRKYMTILQENNRNKISEKHPRNFDKLYARFFDTYLNVPSAADLPDLRKEFICEFVTLFKVELATNFDKSKQYLIDLNTKYEPV